MSCPTENVRPKPGERWRASYEGTVTWDNSSVEGWFSLLPDGGTIPEEFFEPGGHRSPGRGWKYEKLAGTELDRLREMRHRILELANEPEWTPLGRRAILDAVNG